MRREPGRDGKIVEVGGSGNLAPSDPSTVSEIQQNRGGFVFAAYDPTQKRFDIFPPVWCGMLRRSRCVQIFLLKTVPCSVNQQTTSNNM